MKHTPGPWAIEGDPTKTCSQIVEQDGDEIAVMSVGRGMEIDAANAYLIAAAPDLYAELENIALATPNLWENPSHFRAWAQNRARHALAKARGES